MRSGAPWVAREQLAELREVDAPEPVCAVERPGELVGGEPRCGEVEQRAGRCRDRQAVQGGRLVGREQDGAVDGTPVRRARPPGPTATCTIGESERRMSQASAALTWLSTARSPQASTAAQRRPLTPRTRWPSA
jgi:hypothetical protein